MLPWYRVLDLTILIPCFLVSVVCSYRSGFAVLILYRSGGSVRISTDLHGSVLGQYGSVLGQYGSVRISTDLYGSVLGLYWVSTDLYGSIRICTGLYKICTSFPAESVQMAKAKAEF